MRNTSYFLGFLRLFLKKGRLIPISGCGEFSPGDGYGIQIGTGEHGIQPILVFHQSTIHRFPIAELTLDNLECVFYLTAH